VSVTWTAPGDDGSVGTAAAYDLRMSTSPINAGNWDAATPIAGISTPSPAGTREHVVVRGLTNGTPYWFAIKTVDDAGNTSNISNILAWNWVLDTTAPAAPLGVSATLQGNGTVQVSWGPNAEGDLQGYGVYRSVDGGSTYTRLNGGSLVSGTQFVDSTVPGGSTDAWYQVSAQDMSGNESARSAAAHVDLTSVGTQSAGLWTKETGYPNPSRKGASVHLPVVVPSGGGSAVIEIMTSIGQRVRRLDLTGLSPGATEVLWDGRNESGSEVAPGVYTAWLVAGQNRTSVRLVRVPWRAR
jgi:hypothetical protein